jgi:Tfp pilus assembly protein PilF
MEDFWAEIQRLSPDLQIQSKDYETALNLLEKAIAQNPQQPRAQCH